MRRVERQKKKEAGARLWEFAADVAWKGMGKGLQGGEGKGIVYSGRTV